MNDQEQFIKQVEELIKQAPANPEIMQQLVQYVALGVQVAQQQKQSQGAQMAKCGAKLKRKEDGGVVEDKCGAKMKKKEIGGAMKPCNCKKRLAKFGGKIVNVDCNGNIIK